MKSFHHSLMQSVGGRCNLFEAARANQDTSKMARSTLVLDVKPGDSDTDLNELEKRIREIQLDGLMWGISEKVPIAYGLKKIRFSCVLVDDLVCLDDIHEAVEEIEGVQSSDAVSHNKL